MKACAHHTSTYYMFLFTCILSCVNLHCLPRFVEAAPRHVELWTKVYGTFGLDVNP